MATILENGDIKFGDGTTLSSATILFSSVSGLPTMLSQFTNDLPIPAGMINGVVSTQVGGVGNPRPYLGVNGSNQLTLGITLYNCYCNC